MLASEEVGLCQRLPSSSFASRSRPPLRATPSPLEEPASTSVSGVRRPLVLLELEWVGEPSGWGPPLMSRMLHEGAGTGATTGKGRFALHRRTTLAHNQSHWPPASSVPPRPFPPAHVTPSPSIHLMVRGGVSSLASRAWAEAALWKGVVGSTTRSVDLTSITGLRGVGTDGSMVSRGGPEATAQAGEGKFQAGCRGQGDQQRCLSCFERSRHSKIPRSSWLTW